MRMGRAIETAAVETKSSLPLLTTYRPLGLTWPVQTGSLHGPRSIPSSSRWRPGALGRRVLVAATLGTLALLMHLGT